MAKLNYQFFKGEKGLLHKDMIEYKIFDVVRNSKSKEFEEYLNNSNSSEEFCYLSDIRENILNWYPFEKKSALLEIGAGLGTLTGMLCDKVDDVIAVEMTDIRAKIIHEWHKKRENLEIMVGNFNEMTFDKKFDYIVLIGVFEYAKRFLRSENAHVELLEKLKSLLTPNGIILIGIENRLGLKYFSGCMEEHTGKLFLGLNDYDGYDYIRTFSKSELMTIITEAGFEKYRFMYPFPDYGYPCAVYTDEILPYIDFGQSYAISRENYFEFFDEFRMYKSLQKEGCVGSFSNSFLVEIYNGAQPDTLITYAKTPTFKGKSNKTITVICEKNREKFVLKFSPYGKAEEISAYPNIYKRLKSLKNCEEFIFVPAEKNGECIKMPFITNPSLESLLDKQLESALKCDNQNDEFYAKYINNIAQIFNDLVRRWRKGSIESTVYCTEDFACFLGEKKLEKNLECIHYANLDCSIEDFYIDKEDHILVIDYGGTVDFLVPVDYLAYKVINSWYEKKVRFYRNAEKLICLDKLYSECKIKTENLDTYKNWCKFFFNRINPCQSIKNVDELGYSPSFIDVDDIKNHGVKRNKK